MRPLNRMSENTIVALPRDPVMNIPRVKGYPVCLHYTPSKPTSGNIGILKRIMDLYISIKHIRKLDFSMDC